MPKVLILYDTRTGNTGRMARAVADGAKPVQGVEVVLKRVAEGGGELAGADAVVRVIGEAVRARRTPNANDLTKCRDLGHTVAESVATVGRQTE